MHLVCVVIDSNPPASVTWARGSLTLSPSQPWNPGVLELPRVQSKDEGEFTCRAQNAMGSLHMSLSLSLPSECPVDRRGAGGWGEEHTPQSCQQPSEPRFPWDPEYQRPPPAGSGL